MKFSPIKLRLIREGHGLSQTDVASRSLGLLKRCTISKWETGATRPTLDNFLLICKILCVTPNNLVDIEPHGTPVGLTGAAKPAAP